MTTMSRETQAFMITRMPRPVYALSHQRRGPKGCVPKIPTYFERYSIQGRHRADPAPRTAMDMARVRSAITYGLTYVALLAAFVVFTAAVISSPAILQGSTYITLVSAGAAGCVSLYDKFSEAVKQKLYMAALKYVTVHSPQT